MGSKSQISSFLSVIDVARRLGISPNSVWRWSRTRDDFPSPVKLGPGSTRWRLADLIAFGGIGLSRGSRMTWPLKPDAAATAPGGTRNDSKQSSTIADPSMSNLGASASVVSKTPRQQRNARYHASKASERRLKRLNKTVQGVAAFSFPRKVLPPNPYLLNPHPTYPLRPLKGALPPLASMISG